MSPPQQAEWQAQEARVSPMPVKRLCVERSANFQILAWHVAHAARCLPCMYVHARARLERTCMPSSIIACMHASIFAPCAPFHIRAQRANEAAAALRTQQHAARQQQHVCARMCTGTCLRVRTRRPWVKLGAPKPACTHAATAAAAAIATHCKGLRPYHPTGPHATTLCICALRIGSGAGCDHG